MENNIQKKSRNPEKKYSDFFRIFSRWTLVSSHSGYKFKLFFVSKYLDYLPQLIVALTIVSSYQHFEACFQYEILTLSCIGHHGQTVP